jgi:hypothetical protein
LVLVRDADAPPKVGTDGLAAPRGLHPQELRHPFSDKRTKARDTIGRNSNTSDIVYIIYERGLSD